MLQRYIYSAYPRRRAVQCFADCLQVKPHFCVSNPEVVCTVRKYNHKTHSKTIPSFTRLKTKSNTNILISFRIQSFCWIESKCLDLGPDPIFLLNRNPNVFFSVRIQSFCWNRIQKNIFIWVRIQSFCWIECKYLYLGPYPVFLLNRIQIFLSRSGSSLFVEDLNPVFVSKKIEEKIQLKK